MITTQCRACAKFLEIPDQYAGQTGKCNGCGAPVAVPYPQSGKSRTAYVLLGLFLGGFGIHNFYAGYTGKAIAQLLITLTLWWLVIPLLCVGLWVILEVCTVKQTATGDAFA
jgi:TM2 domain-containing membrane protein YozV